MGNKSQLRMTGQSLDERVKASEKRKKALHDIDKQREVMYMRALAQALAERRKDIAERAHAATNIQ